MNNSQPAKLNIAATLFAIYLLAEDRFAVDGKKVYVDGEYAENGYVME